MHWVCLLFGLERRHRSVGSVLTHEGDAPRRYGGFLRNVAQTIYNGSLLASRLGIAFYWGGLETSFKSRAAIFLQASGRRSPTFLMGGSPKTVGPIPRDGVGRPEFASRTKPAVGTHYSLAPSWRSASPALTRSMIRQSLHGSIESESRRIRRLQGTLLLALM
jgi:hypothetical protein